MDFYGRALRFLVSQYSQAKQRSGCVRFVNTSTGDDSTKKSKFQPWRMAPRGQGMDSRQRGIHLADCESNISNNQVAVFVLNRDLGLLDRVQSSWLENLRARTDPAQLKRLSTVLRQERCSKLTWQFPAPIGYSGVCWTVRLGICISINLRLKASESWSIAKNAAGISRGHRKLKWIIGIEERRYP